MVLGLALGLFMFGCASGDVSRVDGSARDGGVDGSSMLTDSGPPCEESFECDDGDACNGVETCTGGRCGTGIAVDCDDAVSCTEDLCNPDDGACSHAPDDTMCGADLVCDPLEGCIVPAPCTSDDDCDDAQLCNGLETCDAAFGCRPGAAPSCDDGIACTTDSCDPAGGGGAGACVQTPDASACSDGRACNGAESCEPAAAGADALGCIPGAPPMCDDGVACTDDACDEAAGGCTSTPNPTGCQDGVFCNGAEVCDPTAGCVAGTPPSCADAIGCTMGRCDAASDACVQEPDTAFCQDGLVCNGVEQCDVSGTTPGRGCVAGVAIDCSDGLACTTDMCNEPGGTCTHGGSDADGDGYIAVGCASGNDCNDLSAAIHPGAVELCDGVDNNCSGGVDDGAGMECARGSGSRTCTTSCGTSGSRACTAACTLTTCIASVETCNDCDDDGNGLIDDGLACRRGTSAPCTTVCGTSGSRVCASDCSGYGACIAPVETCNDCDDDGNGLVDDGLGCRRGSSASCTTSCGTSGTRVCALDCSGFGACRAATETCNGCDDDGNGVIDDGFACRQGSTQSCTTGCGTAGIRTCASDCSGFGACVATEVCNGCDDDGDGLVDEGFLCAAASARSCTTGCGSPGMQTCNGTCSGYSTCVGSELCNGCDDDGDGSADEDFACRQGASSACVTSCSTPGMRTCNATCSGFGACAAPEVCNGCDDDGNGVIDNGFACVMGSSRSCTTSCGNTGTQSCNGTCTGYGTCTSSSEVCSAGSSRSCTTACGNGGTQSCNGTCTGYGTCTSSSEVCSAGSSRTCTTSCGNSGTQTCNGSCTGYGTCTSGSEVCSAGSSRSCTTSCGNTGTQSCNGSCTGYTTCTSGSEVCSAGSSRSCTTACLTPGSQTCNGSCTGYSTCLAPAEVCGNGCDDNGNGSVDEGCGPLNERCTSATPYTIGSVVTGTTSGTVHDYSASCGASSLSPDVAYSFASTGSTTVRTTLHVDTTSHDGTIHVHSSSSCSSTDELGCNDDFGSTRASELAAVYPQGTMYLVVDGYSSGNSGPFTLTSSNATVNPDTCTSGPGGGVVNLAGNGRYTGSTIGRAGNFAGTCASSGAADVVFALTARASGTITIDTCGSTYDTVLYVGTTCGASAVACNDDFCGLQSQISFAATAFTTYYITVDGFSTSSGDFILNISGW